MTKVEDLVKFYFANQKDKAGRPYFEHLQRVSASFSSIDYKVVGLLHDILEDTSCTIEELENMGVPRSWTLSIVHLTKGKEEVYQDYISRLLASNDIRAIMMKEADLKHNMDLSRISCPSTEDKKRLREEYQPSYERIQNWKKERNQI